MKRSLSALALALFCLSADAQHLDPKVVLEKYAAQVVPRCPDGVLTLEPGPAGPANFKVYVLTLRSSDKYCGTQKYFLHSPKSQQVLIGTVFPIPAGPKPIAARITAESSRLLSHPVAATVASFPIADGLKNVALTRETPFGPFAYRAFLDASEKFMIVGFRGSLTTDPTKTLRESLAVSNGVRRGNAASRVEIIELSDFQCPTCARAHEKLEPVIQKNLSKLNYVRLDLPLFEHHQWALPAALAARAISRVAPSAYWEYVDYVFENQETIGKRPFMQVLREYCDDHDIDWGAVEKVVNSKEERQIMLDQVSRAFSAGIASTPTFIVNGQVMGYGPEGSFAIEAIKNAIGAPKPVAAKK